VRDSSLISKRAVRVLGVAESFTLSRPRSVMVGVVMRSDWVIDGAALGSATVGGLDASQSIIDLYNRLGRSDVHLVMIDGCIVSWYNVIDLDAIHESLGVPVMCLSFEDIKGDAATAISKLFQDAPMRLRLLHELGRPMIIPTPHGTLWARSRGLSYGTIKVVIHRFQREGKKPEPIRVSKLLASALLRNGIHDQ